MMKNKVGKSIMVLEIKGMFTLSCFYESYRKLTHSKMLWLMYFHEKHSFLIHTQSNSRRYVLY